MQIFNAILTRISGDSFDEWTRIESPTTNGLKSKIEHLKENKDKLKFSISERLLNEMKKIEDSKLKNAVLNFRRDFFNERKISNKDFLLLSNLIPPNVLLEINKYYKVREKYCKLIATGEEIYNDELTANNRVLVKLACSETFQKGLLLSSSSLFDKIKNVNNKIFDPQLEFGIVKYLTRIYTKTSPFSSFTNLFLCHLSERDDFCSMSNLSSTSEIQSHIRLNNSIFKHILLLLRGYRDFYARLPINHNPTIVKKDLEFNFLTNFNNVEAFQTIQSNAILDLILRELKNQTVDINLIELTGLLEKFVDGSSEEIERYLKNLIDLGFLEYDIGIPGTAHNWERLLIDKLLELSFKSDKISYLNKLIETLIRAEESRKAYATMDVVGRTLIIENLFKDLYELCTTLEQVSNLSKAEKVKNYKEDPSNFNDSKNKDSNKVFKHQASTNFNFRPEQLFFEDTVRQIKGEISRENIRRIVEDLDLLLEALSLTNIDIDKIKMKHFFINRYGHESKIELLVFYKDYYKDFKLPEQTRKSANEKENVRTDVGEEAINQIPEIENERKLQKKWMDAFINEFEPLVKTCDEVNIKFENIIKINSSLGLNSDKSRKGVSIGAFLQFYLDVNGNAKTVVNSVFPGYGKMISRFLHLFHPNTTCELRELNQLSENESNIFIENCDGTFFSANIHPPLMSYEIWAPGSSNGIRHEKRLAVTDFLVCISNDELVLIYKPTGQRAFVFDLGFQSQSGRSQLFQLLGKFTKAEYLSEYSIVSCIHKLARATGSGELTEYPRIVYNDNIILHRRKWEFSTKILPCKEKFESDWNYYLKVNAWKKTYNIPNEVFILIYSRHEISYLKRSPSIKRLSRDDYKPQYIDFNNPLLVRLFARIVRKVPQVLTVYEMLPNSRQMLKVNNKSYATEFLVQWYK
jgi:hypothetical protein